MRNVRNKILMRRIWMRRCSRRDRSSGWPSIQSGPFSFLPLSADHATFVPPNKSRNSYISYFLRDCTEAQRKYKFCFIPDKCFCSHFYVCYLCDSRLKTKRTLWLKARLQSFDMQNSQNPIFISLNWFIKVILECIFLRPQLTTDGGRRHLDTLVA